MRIRKIKTYQYKELDALAKIDVKIWLDEFPLEYEKEDGTFGYDYFSDLEDDLVQEHCEMNGYVFTKKGKPVHNLLVKNKYMGQGRTERQIETNNKMLFFSFLGLVACILFILLAR